MHMTRRAAAGLLAAGLASPAFAQALGAQPSDLVETPEAGDDAETATNIATTDGRYAHKIAPVMIAGQGPFNFLIDTGANASCISQRLANQLGLEATNPATVHSVVGAQTRPRVIIPELKIGDRVRRNVKAPALGIRLNDFEGVLGVDWLKGQRLVLDFAGKNLEITKSQAEDTMEGRVVVPARRRSGQLTIVDADLGGKRISCLIDSGSPISICNGPLRRLAESQDKSNAVGKKTTPVELQAITGETFIGQMIFLPFVRLGGLHLGAVPVVHADVHIFRIWDLDKTPAMVLGMDLLTQFKAVALDYGRSRVRFDLA